MPGLLRSALFKRQFVDITSSCGARPGPEVAPKFVDQIDADIRVVATKPLACAIYNAG
ncbi:hypothetical protein [Breoghania sp. L-A4]|uniref:hypothetical protein n=1 Tax=Breoghania sp. L-A4 TaxID=2304600 RepID=UPI0013C31312|nr:hypothetical protein [Breoghania sp. L-A4]